MMALFSLKGALSPRTLVSTKQRGRTLEKIESVSVGLGDESAVNVLLEDRSSVPGTLVR